jgi:hypothetical protein
LILKGVVNMKRRVFAASALIALAAMPAHAQLSVGAEAPALSAGSWLNLPPGVAALTQAHLKDQIVMVEFWATW